MSALQSPRNRLIAALAALVLLAAAGVSQGLSAAGAARLLLGLSCVGGIAAWFIKQRGGLRTGFKATPRLSVVSRASLSQRAGVALVEVDGQSYLVVHGDGYARLRPTKRPRPIPLRRATDEVRPVVLHRRGGVS